MIRFSAVLAVFLIMAGFGGGAFAQSTPLYVTGDRDTEEGAQPIFNPSSSQSSSRVYKGSQPEYVAPKDQLSQMLQENERADYEIIKNESVRVQQKAMERTAARAAEKAAMDEEFAKQNPEAMMEALAEEVPLEEEQEEEEPQENVKKVYIQKGGSGKPKKVFNSYD